MLGRIATINTTLASDLLPQTWRQEETRAPSLQAHHDRQVEGSRSWRQEEAKIPGLQAHSRCQAGERFSQESERVEFEAQGRKDTG